MMIRRIARTAVIELSRTEKQTVWNDAEQEAAARPGRHAVSPPSYGTNALAFDIIQLKVTP
jgi:hypothetical protein